MGFQPMTLLMSGIPMPPPPATVPGILAAIPNRNLPFVRIAFYVGCPFKEAHSWISFRQLRMEMRST